MAKFFAGVWFGDNRYSFDFIGAMKNLSPRSLQIIQNWINKPFFP